MTDLKILAESAFQVTAGKKYCPGPMASDQRAFLTVMGPGGGDDDVFPDPAKTDLVIQAVNTAAAGTNRTVLIELIGLFDFFSEITFHIANLVIKPVLLTGCFNQEVNQ